MSNSWNPDDVITTLVILSLLVDAKADKPKAKAGKTVESVKKKKGAADSAAEGADGASDAPDAPASAAPAAPPSPAPAAAAPAAAGVSVTAPAPAAEIKAAPSDEAAAPRVRPPLRIAVYELELQDVAVPVGIVVSDSLLGEVRKLQGISAIGMSEIRDMLTHEATKQLAGCSEGAESCMAELAGALGVDELVTGKLAKVGDSSVMTLRRIDHKRAAVTKVFDQRLKLANGSEYLAAVGPAVEQMFSDFRLKEGAVRGVAKDVALRLDPPPIPVAATLAVGGVAAGAAIAAGVFSVLFLFAQNAYDAKATEGTIQPIQGSELKALESTLVQRQWLANGFWIGSGSVALIATVMAFFTDWKGYKQQTAKLSTKVE